MQVRKTELQEWVTQYYEKDRQKVEAAFILCNKRATSVKTLVNEIENFERAIQDEKLALKYAQDLKDYELRGKNVNFQFYPEVRSQRYWLDYNDPKLDRFGFIKNEPVKSLKKTDKRY